MSAGTIEAVPVTRYRAVCATCDRRFGLNSKQGAEWDLKSHECGVHRQQHDNRGGYRGILGYRFECICGAIYAPADPSEPFICPKEPQ